jgi:hypothetical protein
MGATASTHKGRPHQRFCMKGLHVTCAATAITFTGICQVRGSALSLAVPDARVRGASTGEILTPRPLSATVPNPVAGLGNTLGLEPRSVPGLSLANAEVGYCYFQLPPFAARLPPIARNVTDEVSHRKVTQDFRYLIYYAWSELPPAEKPADIVLNSLKNTPVGTPIEEIERVSEAFGLDSNFMKAVAKNRVRLRPQAAHRVVYRPVPIEQS